MLSHRRALIALTVLALTAGSARAQDASADRLDPGLGLKLRLQQSLLPPTAPDPTEDLPVFVEADRIQGVMNRYLQAEGEAALRRRGQAVFADELRYSFQSNEVTATGHVRLYQLGDTITGSYASFNLDNNSGTIDNPTFRFRQFHARGQAIKLLIRD